MGPGKRKGREINEDCDRGINILRKARQRERQRTGVYRDFPISLRQSIGTSLSVL